MPGEKNIGHVKQGNDRPVDDVHTRDLSKRNNAIGAERGMTAEEPHDIHKAGGGTVGGSLGGAHEGRYGPAPAKVTSNRATKPRGQDKA